jgi:hypothetical protein
MSLSPRSSAGPDDGEDCGLARWLRVELHAHADAINVSTPTPLNQRNYFTKFTMMSRLDV